MVKKRLLLLIGIAMVLSIIMVQASFAVEYCTSHYVQQQSKRGSDISITAFCQPGEYAVLLPQTGCKAGALINTWESPYGNAAHAYCDHYRTYDPIKGTVERVQVVHLYYACCNYDIIDPDTDPFTDDCDFPGMRERISKEFNVDTTVPDLTNCPDVVPNEENIKLGWVFPKTYEYKALDCHPEDDIYYESTRPEDAGKYLGPKEESASESVSQSTARAPPDGVCVNSLDDDCDGSIDELDECEADVDVNICSIDDGLYWNVNLASTGQACCGDDVPGSDCGRIINNQICTDTGWLDANKDTVGEIYSDACDGEIVFDSSKPNRCQPVLKPRTFNLKIQKQKAPLPPFYDEFTYKQLTVHEGVNDLSNLANYIIKDGEIYTISSDDPEVKVTFASSYADAESKFVQQPDVSIYQHLNEPDTIYALYTPNTLNSFEKVSVSKDNEIIHDYVCYEKEPDTKSEAKIVAECAGKYVSEDAFSSTYGERAETGEKRNSSILLYDTFKNVLALDSARIDFLQGLTLTEEDKGAGVLSENPILIYSATGNIDHRQGTIEFWVRPLWNSTTDNKERVFFNFQEADNGHLRIRKLGSETLGSGTIEFIIKFGNAELKVHLTKNLVAGKWYKLRMSWNNTNILASITDINGDVLEGADSGNLPGLPKSLTFSLGMMEGSNPYVANAVFDNLKIYRNFKPTAYYCTDNFEWADDLDDVAAHPEYEDACMLASDLKWTGSHCCGEPADSPEYYNDIGTDYPDVGGCWASEHMDWGELPEIGDNPPDEGPVINYQGQFEGCRITGTDIASFTDVFTDDQLVENNPEDSQDPNQMCPLLIDAKGGEIDFYCSMDGNWKKAAPYDTKTSMPSFLTSEDSRQVKNDFKQQSQECCALNDCWNGSICIKNQRHDAGYVLFDGYRCLDGSWIVQPPRLTWDRQDKGFCPQQTQCLVNPGGDADNNDKPDTFFTGEPPQCIQDKQYIKQYYCDNGNWTTRTKLLALQLIDLAAPTGDYELFCGDFDDVLTYVGYDPFDRTTNVRAVQNYLTECSFNTPCVNQFCVVKYANGVAFGTSLNIEIDDVSNSFLSALGKDKSICNNAINDDDDYDLCSNNIYYNHDTKSIIKVLSGTLAQTTTQQLLANRNFEIQNRFMNINTYVKPLDSLQFSEYGKALVNSTGLFENIFLVKKGSKSLFAYLEEKQYKTEIKTSVDDIGVLFTGLPLADNPCSITHIGQTNLYAEDYACSYSNNNLRFVGVYPSGQTTKPTIKELWRGLTSLLRIN